LFDGGAVEDLGLHEDDWIGVADGAEKEAFCLNGGAGDHDLYEPVGDWDWWKLS
jgi:hypothetical protein